MHCRYSTQCAEIFTFDFLFVSLKSQKRLMANIQTWSSFNQLKGTPVQSTPLLPTKSFDFLKPINKQQEKQGNLRDSWSNVSWLNGGCCTPHRAKRHFYRKNTSIAIQQLQDSLHWPQNNSEQKMVETGKGRIKLTQRLQMKCKMKLLLFSVTRRSRSDSVSQSLTDSKNQVN